MNALLNHITTYEEGFPFCIYKSGKDQACFRSKVRSSSYGSGLTSKEVIEGGLSLSTKPGDLKNVLQNIGKDHDLSPIPLVSHLGSRFLRVDAPSQGIF